MSKDEDEDDDFGDDDEVDGDLDEIDELDDDAEDILEELDKSAKSRDARRRLELLKEELELARLISDDYDDD